MKTQTLPYYINGTEELRHACVCTNCLSVAPAFPKESLVPKEVSSPEIHLAHILIIMLLYVSFNFIPNSLRSQEISFLVGGCLPISEFIKKR